MVLRLFRKTSGINLNNNWKKLEKKLVEYMEENFPDYNFETQKTYSGHGKRPDVYGQHKKMGIHHELHGRRSKMFARCIDPSLHV